MSHEPDVSHNRKRLDHIQGTINQAFRIGEKLNNLTVNLLNQFRQNPQDSDVLHRLQQINRRQNHVAEICSKGFLNANQTIEKVKKDTLKTLPWNQRIKKSIQHHITFIKKEEEIIDDYTSLANTLEKELGSILVEFSNLTQLLKEQKIILKAMKHNPQPQLIQNLTQINNTIIQKMKKMRTREFPAELKELLSRLKTQMSSHKKFAAILAANAAFPHYLYAPAGGVFILIAFAMEIVIPVSAGLCVVVTDAPEIFHMQGK